MCKCTRVPLNFNFRIYKLLGAFSDWHVRKKKERGRERVGEEEAEERLDLLNLS